MPPHTNKRKEDKNRKGARKLKPPPLNENGRPAKQKRIKEVVFDLEQRKEFLTGFSKRKKAKQTEKRNKAIARDKEEMRDMRKSIRDERKERAAHNVKVAKQMYGDAGSSDDGEGTPMDGGGSDVDLGESDSDSDGDDNDGSPGPEAVFESADALTTVSVAPLSFSRSPTPEPLATPREAKPERTQEGSKYKKRVRNTVQARPKLTRKDRKEIVTGGKKVKKKMLTRMKGTKARSAR